MQTVVMVVEGILREPNSEAPIAEGITLYRGLAESSRLYLLSAMWTPREMARWVFSRTIEQRHIGFQTALTPSPEDRINALSRIATWNPALVLESDPLCAEAEYRAGYPTMLFALPAYRAVSWRPDSPSGPQPWDAIAAEMARQEELRYTDERLKEA
jgi:hypothetical protein